MIKTILSTTIAISVSSLLLVGCGSTVQKVEKKEIKKVVKTSDTQGRPLWVSNPDLNGNIGVVSVTSKAKIKSKKKLHYIAKMKAQASFETRKGTRIASNSKISISNDGKTNYEESIKMSSKSIQTSKLVEKSIFEDKENYYLWMVVEK